MKKNPLAIILAGLIGLSTNTQARSQHLATQTFLPNPLEAGAQSEHVIAEAKTGAHKLRTFTLKSSQQQRDDKEKIRVFSENPDYPLVHTDNLMFDALYAMAVDDLRLDSVQAIRDSSYNKGEAIACNCFETGEKWNYVWTRDLSYSVNLSLAQFDPVRSVNSLLFKTSSFREQVYKPVQIPEKSTQIIQDTGSGGSWPISTDRVSWALAAKSVLQNLTGIEREKFLDKAYAALIGTIEADRMAAFDNSAGLYGGEQSFMDWRTQTYAPWIVDNLSRMAQSKALSTNLLHYNALNLAAELAREKNNAPLADKYNSWAKDLKQKINEKFWLADVGLYSTMTSAAEDTAPVYKYDMLGNALAVLLDVATPEQAQKIMARYPNSLMGIPVYYPQMPNVYVYHNRAIWPFVTAYALNAAVKVNNNKVANNAIQSLMRGAALNLSNMENLEWLTGKPFYDDGPAISSRRQLWSVAAYLNMVTNTIFGIQLTDQGLNVKPFMTPEIVATLGGKKEVSLDNITLKGHTFSVQLILPKVTPAAAGVYPVASILLNGKPVSGVISDAQLASAKIIRVSFGELVENTTTITMADNVNPSSHDDAKVFSPEVPTDVKITRELGKFAVRFKAASNSAKEDLVFTIYKNGKAVAKQISATQWIDSEAANMQVRNCFAVESEFARSGNKSLHSEPACDDGDAAQFIPVTDKHTRSNLKPLEDAHFAMPVLREWGSKDDSLQFTQVAIRSPGKYAIQVLYNNRQHSIDSGITNAVKTFTLLNDKNKILQTSVVQMPNVKDEGDKYPINTSTEVTATLDKGTYTFQLGDFFNMSYLQSNSTYLGSGGTAGPVNKASIAGIKIVRLE